MDVHQKIAGVLMAVLGGFGLLSVLGGVLMMVAGIQFLPFGFGFGLNLFLIVLGGSYALWSMLALWAGLVAANEGQARGLMVTAAVMALIGFPFGTAVGAYTLWAYWRQDAVQVIR